MTRRFPPAIPGLPNDRGRYRVILETLDSSDSPPTKEEFVPACRRAIEAAETDDETELSDSWTRHIISDMIRSGFISETDANGKSGLVVSEDSQRWLQDNREFEDFVYNAIKRGWVLKKQFPEGFEALERILHAITYELDQPTSSRALKSILKEEYDYKFSRQGIRGYVPLLDQMGMLERTDKGIIIPADVEPESELERLRNGNIFHQLERWLRREGAKADPPANTGKRALMKYYMYRESGGWRKRRTWYDKFHTNYLSPSVRQDPYKNTNPDLDRHEDYTEAEGRRDRLRDQIIEEYGFEKSALSSLSIDELQVIAEADDRNAARKAWIQCGSGVSRGDFTSFVSADREYAFDDEFELYDWQAEAADAWFEGTERTNPTEGIAEVVTGAGKTVMALEVIRRWLDANDDGVVTIVVPTRVLMYQWLTELTSKLNVPIDDLGWAGDGNRDRFNEGVRVLVTIVNTAVKDEYLQGILADVDNPPHLLVADECHNYTGDIHSNVLRYHSTAMLGLSATPTDAPTGDSEQVSDAAVERSQAPTERAEPSADDALLFKQLGPVFYTLTYSEAIERGLIPQFKVNYVGFDLTKRERQTYESLTRDIVNAINDIEARYGNRLYELNGNFQQKLNIIRNSEEASHPTIGQYFTLTQERRDLVQDAVARQAITLKLLRAIEPDEKAIVFQEKIEQLEQLIAPREHLGISREGDIVRGTGLRSEKYEEYPDLKEVDERMEELFAEPDFWPVMYHSGHSRDIWNQFAMEWFRADGYADVMFSVKALIEGVDVPDADIGIIRVSSGSVRQRIQTLGRILRTGDDPDNVSQLWVLYARDTVDENIFRNYDWDEQLGNADINHYVWEIDEGPLDGSIKQTSDPLPQPEEYTEPDYPDPEDLSPGDSYTGPTQGYKISVETSGQPFEKTSDGRRYIINDKIQEAAEIVHREKGGGSIIINEQGHMLTKLPDDVIFLGVTDGPASFSYDEERTRSLTDEPPDYEDIFDS
jgi:superfamily II DNA or RNA helicase